MIESDEEEVERFMRYVDKLPNGCWFWMGARSRGRGKRWYGSFWTKRHGSVRAHRFASEVLNGDPCPPGHHRDHTCHFSMCVCPDHIEVVSEQENLKRRRKHD